MCNGEKMNETKRQFFHVLTGLFLILLYLFLEKKTIIIITIGIIITTFFIGLAIKKGLKLGFLQKMIESMQRKNEKHFSGLALIIFVMGFLLLFLADMYLIQNKNIVLTALLIGTFSDAVSNVVGTNFGKTKLVFDKTVKGTIAGFLVSLLILFFFFPNNLLAVLFTALIATSIDLMPIEDNLLIPIVSGIVLFALL